MTDLCWLLESSTFGSFVVLWRASKTPRRFFGKSQRSHGMEDQSVGAVCFLTLCTSPPDSLSLAAATRHPSCKAADLSIGDAASETSWAATLGGRQSIAHKGVRAIVGGKAAARSDGMLQKPVFALPGYQQLVWTPFCVILWSWLILRGPTLQNLCRASRFSNLFAIGWSVARGVTLHSWKWGCRTLMLARQGKCRNSSCLSNSVAQCTGVSQPHFRVAVLETASGPRSATMSAHGRWCSWEVS